MLYSLSVWPATLKVSGWIQAITVKASVRSKSSLPGTCRYPLPSS